MSQIPVHGNYPIHLHKRVCIDSEIHSFQLTNQAIQYVA